MRRQRCECGGSSGSLGGGGVCGMLGGVVRGVGGGLTWDRVETSTRSRYAAQQKPLRIFGSSTRLEGRRADQDADQR